MPYKDPAMQRARSRNREHLKRAAVSDITHAQELAMRERARKCPLCDVRMTDKPHLPNSKELDHILPVNQGGTHTHGNVRIICRKCNQSRPKDGSDYTGMLTLWAHDPGAVSRKRTTCRAGLHPYSKGGCKACRKTQPYEDKRSKPRKQCKCGALFAAPGNQFMCAACIDAAAHKAAELHASGLTWSQVAVEVGYTTFEGARYAAKRIGYRPTPKQAAPPQRPLCMCGAPVGGNRGGRGGSICGACVTERAWRAVEMRFEQGRTLRYIADQLGFVSITSVTNLMKTVVTIESQMGRPPS
jgi:hypothetical protein